MSVTDTVVVDVNDLRVTLGSGTPIVDGVDLRLRRGEILGIVGESGSGKTTTALALLGYAQRGARIASGQVVVAGKQVLALAEPALREVRGREISYVPQDAAQALNPSLRIAGSLTDVIRRGEQDGRFDVPTLLAAVDLPATREFGRRLPHQLSGGQQQRVTIAMSMGCRPDVIVMDELTTGLDVITQRSVLKEIARLRDDEGVSLVYVSHDLAVVSQIADRIAVMYAGRIVEQGPTAALLGRLRHPLHSRFVAVDPRSPAPGRLRPDARHRARHRGPAGWLSSLLRAVRRRRTSARPASQSSNPSTRCTRLGACTGVRRSRPRRGQQLSAGASRPTSRSQ